MSDRPPRDSDDLSLGGLVDEVVSQVRVALDEADVTSHRSRALLLDGLRDVLGALDPASLVRPDRTPPAGAPDVSVVDGGRAEDAPPTEGARPDLRVADPAEAGSGPEPAEVPRVVPRVIVHRPPDPAHDRLPRLRLAAGSWTTVFRGSTPRPYRLHAGASAVTVRLDERSVDQLPAGGSLDVEAAVVQATVDDGEAVLRYERLPS